MNNIDINKLVRENIKNLKPYSSARDEYTGNDAIFLDANENPNSSPYNRYPDPLQWNLKSRIAEIKGTVPENIFLGNGSDEAIDLLIRAFCEPGVDNILSIDPSYGMYKVCADISNVEFRLVSLKEDFSLDTSALLNRADGNSKLMFLCSPNNPTSNSLNEKDIIVLLNRFNGLVVLDEAYIDFSSQKSLLDRLPEYPNLVILQTFSKAWGLAGIRLGMAFADSVIIALMNKIKYPYNINSLTLKVALDNLLAEDVMKKWVSEILKERERVKVELLKFPDVIKVYPSDANFLLVKVNSPAAMYDYLVGEKIIVRDRSKVNLCEGCLRITIGTRQENDMLLQALRASKIKKA